MFKEVIQSIGDIDRVAREFLEAHSDETVFAFYGTMGVGKTTFIKALCEVLEVEDYVTSPTFSLVNEYASSKGNIFHFDFYRIKNIQEVYDFGYEEYFYSGKICLIEWPELIDPLLPTNTVVVKLEEQEDGTRMITTQKL
ncbi:tRNA (adenosine(37)-N6)-threonylcarbamoyltransferase complex ATPase subunit type 1 TsaE [Halosquirtibacter laminarini]|uniref:tRNA (Adenosine(37)-N6)-threonylcarbamoyltransferase complex ATPase subunit type 1 TsaE n=1 Tax=Halosquirtibacter laminarini TaxID=3374600 RepID=A0AC61NF20_9BACT|nr:tRNA (adenosine(37)-N6)-threonylcarbamoyltransferase complex ATPase subunit type 1 TsaE [Prolixibacteraceae bacterium]